MRLVKPRGSTKIEQPKALCANRWASSLSKIGWSITNGWLIKEGGLQQGLLVGCHLPLVSRDNNLYVVGDISKKCLDTTETNNYQVTQEAPQNT